MLKAQSTITLFSLPLVFVLTFACTRVLAQGFAADWPAKHKNDLSKWAAKTGLSFKTLDELTKVATEEEASEVDEGYFWYTIENVDAKTLSKQKHILLSTWAAGTGHCLTLYVLKRTGSNFEKVWQSYDNLCTRSILGAAKTRAKADGTISVTYREYSVDSDPKKDALPILMVTLTYKWDGTAYINAGRIERPEASVSVR